MKIVQISSDDVATIIESVIYADGLEEFDSVLERGFEEIEEFAEILRNADIDFEIKTTGGDTDD